MRSLNFFILKATAQNPFDINPIGVVVKNPLAHLWVAILVSFVAFTILFTLFRPLVMRCLYAFASINGFKQLIKDIHSKGIFAFIFPFIASVYSLAIFCNLLFAKWSVNQIFLAICLVILIKVIAVRLVGLLYGFKKASHYYSSTIIVLYIVLGILLAPINLFAMFPSLAFEKVLFITGILFTITMFFLRYFRAAQINFTLVSPNKFHFLLYICTLEIGPFLVIYKLIFSQLLL